MERGADIIVNEIGNFAFSHAKASIYGFGKNRKQKFIMSFTIDNAEDDGK